MSLYSTPLKLKFNKLTLSKISDGFAIVGNDVANNRGSTLLLDTRGKLWGWGYNKYGCIGINRSEAYLETPVAVCGNHTFCKISIGNNHSSCIDNHGKAWGWGANYMGCIGNNDNVNNYSTPVAVCGNHTFCEISSGNNHTVAIDNHGKAWGWGRWYGIGYGLMTDRSTPVAVFQGDGPVVTFCKISGGFDISLAVDNHGIGWGWGYNYYGNIGDGTSGNQYCTPVAICGHHTFCDIRARGYTTIGIDNHGIGWGWGYGANGELGNNSTPSSENLPVAICGNHTFCSIVDNSAVALDNHNVAWGWGSSLTGQGDLTTYFTPFAVYGGHVFSKISNNIGIDTRKKAWGWGVTSDLALGYNQYFPSNKISISNIDKYSNDYGANYYIINGIAWGWGSNFFGNLGNNSSTATSTPVAVCGNHTFCEIYAKNNTVFGIDNHGKAWGWGYGTVGKLGNNATTSKSTPVAVCGNHTFCKISMDNGNTVAIDNHGKAWGWGNNAVGGLGDNTTSHRCTPVAVCGSHTFCDITNAYENSMSIDNHGKAWSWGYNFHGELGINNTSSYSTPVAVCGNHTFCQISASGERCLSLDNHGKAWGWGSDSYGQIGNNYIGYVAIVTPVAVCGNHTFCHIYASVNTSYGLDNRGRAWAWGQNQNGQIGNKSYSLAVGTPVSVFGNHTFCSIISGYNYVLAQDHDGVMWAWGLNDINSLLGYPIYIGTPIAVCGF